MVKSFNYILVLNIFIVALTCGNATAQILELPSIPLPVEITSQYPFLTDKFYDVIAPEIDGNLGYSVFLLDKQKLEDFYKKKNKGHLGGYFAKKQLFPR